MSDKARKDAFRCYERLCDTPRIRVAKRNQADSESLYHNQTEPFHDELNGGWAKPLIRYNPNQYELEPLPKFRDPINSPLELDPQDTPALNSSHQIDRSKVQDFLDIEPTPVIEDIHSLSEVAKPQTKFPFEIQLPVRGTDIKSLLTIEMKYFKIYDTPPGEQYSGFIQIYDFETYNPLSEPVYFTFDNFSVKLTQTEQKVIFVPIRNLQLKLTLACFIQKKPADSPVYNLYACSYCPLYDEDQNLSTEIKFAQNWFHIGNWKDVQSLFTLDETREDSTVKIDSKIEVLQIKDMNQIKNMRFTYSWKGKSTLCYSALPLYPLPDNPSPVGSIFNLHFILNNPPANSDLYMKVIAINEGGEINIKDVDTKYKKLSIFPLENSELKDTFITSSSPSSNEYYTPECIRIFVNNEITENTLIVLYLMSRQNKKGKIKEEIYKVGVIELKNLEANLQATQRVPLFDFKGFPKKYLSQPKKMNKTYLQYTIALPPVFFPTPFCRQLFNANENNIPEFPTDMNIHLSSAIIPIVAKLLSIRSGKILDKLLTLLEKFNNSPLSPSSSLASLPASPLSGKRDKKDKKDKNKDSSNLSLNPSMSFVFNGSTESKRYKEILSYWIFNNFDASTCRPDFFCETLHDYIQENIHCISSIDQQYDNTREMMHEISGGNIDLNSTKLINSSSNIDSKKDSKRESKKEKKANLQLQTQLVNDLKKARDALIRIVENYDILLDIVAATISHYIKQNKKELKDDFIPRSEPIVSFFKDFGNFLVELDFIETSESTIAKIAKKFAQVLYMVQTFFSNKEISDIVFQIFYDTSLSVDENNRVKQFALKVQLYVMQCLSYTPGLFLAASSITQELSITRPFSPFNRVFGQIFKMASNLFLYDWREQDTEDLMYIFCGNLSILTSQLEERIAYNHTKAHVCYFLLPLVINLSLYYDKLEDMVGLQSSIIPFILFVLNNCDREYLFKYYHNLSTISQTNIIAFLKTIATVALATETVGKYGYIKQISQRLLNVLLAFVDGLGQSMIQIVDLMNLLLFDNEYQTPLNYPNFYNFLSQLMSKQKVNSALIHLLLDNINAKYHSLRCLCTSLLSWQINADYTRNKDIVQSSIHMLDSLTAILLQGSTDDIQTHLNLISLLTFLATNYGDEKFSTMVKDRMKTARVIADVIEEQKRSVQPPEVRCHQMMTIADEYKLLPSMRIKWLQQILTINLEDDNYVAAFITQMHIIALIAAIYDHRRRIDLKNAGMTSIVTARKGHHLSPAGSDSEDSNESSSDESDVLPDPPFHLMIVRPIENAYPKWDYVHSQPYLDFEFLPEVALETQINFDEFQQGSWELLQSFDFKMLQEEIDKAFELGMKAELFYSLRPLASLLLRIFYISRNFEGLSRASDLLQKALLRISFESCTLVHDVNLQFYLVDMITDRGENYRQVYCVKLGERSPRADYETEAQVQLSNQNSSPPQSKNSSESKVKQIVVETAEDKACFVIGSDVGQLDRKFVKMIYSKERFGERKIKFCNQHDPQNCADKDTVCVVRLEPTGNIPIDDEDPHCWNTFQTRITKKLLKNINSDTISLVQVETKVPAPHYKTTVDVTDFKVVEKSKVEVVKDIALYSAAVLDALSENLESYFEYENAETWNIKSDESYNYEFVDKLHILQSVLGMNERVGTSDDDNSILGLLTALKAKNMDDAKSIVQEIIQPSLRRALMIFQRGKKELTSMENYIENVGSTLAAANDFLSTFDAEQIKEDDCYMSTTNTVWQKFKFEKDINY